MKTRVRGGAQLAKRSLVCTKPWVHPQATPLGVVALADLWRRSLHYSLKATLVTCIPTAIG